MAPVVRSRDAKSSRFREGTVEKWLLVASHSKLLEADPYPGGVSRPLRPGQREDIGTWRCQSLGVGLGQDGSGELT